jgi:hypothetical protein
MWEVRLRPFDQGCAATHSIVRNEVWDVATRPESQGF